MRNRFHEVKLKSSGSELAILCMATFNKRKLSKHLPELNHDKFVEIQCNKIIFRGLKNICSLMILFFCVLGRVQLILKI